MTLDSFFKKFDTFADAPDGVARMRELVLELAVQGKLVPQNPTDEAASVILKKIDDSLRQMPKGATRKKIEQIPPVDPEELPFTLPKEWEWCRLGKLGSIGSSCRVHQKDWTSSGVPFLRAREIVKLAKFGQVNNELFITETLFQELSKDGLAPEEDDLMITGVGTIGVPYIVKAADRFYFKDASVLIFKNLFRQFPLYLQVVLQSPYGIKEIHRDSMGTTVHTLTIIRANLIPIPLPPLAEQKRIVAKVDELMALCDRLEAQQQERDEQSSALARASLARFAEAPTPANLNLLFHKSYSIPPAELRKVILSLAVRGKLVPQNPKDELPAIPSDGQSVSNSEWVSRLQLPDTWLWARFESLLAVLKNGFNGKPSKAVSQFKVTRIETIARETIDLARVGYADDLPSDVVAKHAVVKGDILFSHINSEPHLGKTAICTIDDPRLVHGVNLLLLRPIAGIDSSYLNITLRELRAAGYFVSIAQRAVNQASINQKNLGKTPIPIPPLAEQRRIVAKVDQLMALVDELETQLAESRATAKNLLDALVAELALIP